MSNVPFLGSKSAHFYVEEVTPGVLPPTPNWTKVRYTGGFPAVVKDALLSNELDNSGEITSIRTGNESVSGEFAIELSQKSQDDLLASAMSSSWASGSTEAALTITVDEVAKTYTRSTGDFTTNTDVGDLVQFKDLSGNNAKPFIATTVTALVITGAAITVELEVEAAATTDYATGDKLETGNLCRTFSVLTWLVGRCGTVDSYILTTGVEFTGFNIEVAVNSSVTGSFPFIGRKQEVLAGLPAGSTFEPDLTTKQFSGTDGKIVKDGAVLAFVTSMSISNENGAAGQFELGSKYTAFVERAIATNTISASAFMDDTSLLSEFINEDSVNFATILSGVDGAMAFSHPVATLTAVTPDIAGPTSVTQTVEATATGNSNQSSLTVQRLPAA